jgi:hypothetical protein
MNEIKSPVNQVLRNSYRVFNHTDLIQKKLNVGKKWNLISNPKSSEEQNTEIMSTVLDLQKQKISTTTAAQKISSLNNKSVDDLVQDMNSIYQTGQLEFHITDKCDLDCIDCHYAHKSGATIEFDKLSMILSDIAPKAITVTGGGEPNIYKSQGKTLNDVILLIHQILPNTQIGLINNNTHIPEGTWTDHILWQRSSVDSSNADTYKRIKRMDTYNDVVANAKYMLTSTQIQHVGIGFLYRAENSNEIFDFLMGWYEWYKDQSPTTQRKMNVQFRPISPPIEQVSSIISGATYLPKEISEKVKIEVEKTIEKIKIDSEFANFIENSTNFQSLVDKTKEVNPFLHIAKPFNHCYNALIHRVFRSNGAEFPDFLLPAFPEYSLGNTLQGIPEEERTKIGLMQYFFFNKAGKFCNPNCCRQSEISHIIENPDNSRIMTRPTDNYFF